MQIGDNVVLSEIVDGQIFYLPNFQQWEELLNTDPIINGKHLISLPGKELQGRIDIVRGLMEFTLKYPIFSLAFYEILPKRPWYFCVILRKEDTWQRVDIGGRTCEKCGWTGSVADPTNSTLYAGSSEKAESVDEAWNIGTIGCPRCNNKLSGHIIWIGNES